MQSKIEVYVRVLETNSRTVPKLVIPPTTKRGRPYTLPPPSKVTTPKQRRPPFRTPSRPNISSDTTGPDDLNSTTEDATESTPHGKSDRSAGLDITVSLVPIITIVGFVPLIGFVAWLVQRRCKDKRNLVIQKEVRTRLPFRFCVSSVSSHCPSFC